MLFSLWQGHPGCGRDERDARDTLGHMEPLGCLGATTVWRKRWGFEIGNVELTSQPVARTAMTRTGSPSPRPKKKGRSGKTNPIELTCFLSTTYGKEERNKPKGDISNVFSSLERN